MNKKYLLITIMILSVGILYKQSLQSMKRSSSSSPSSPAGAGMVTLESSDGKKFQISRAAAKQSPMIKAVLEMNSEEAQSGIIQFRFIPGDLLEKMVSVLEKPMYEVEENKLKIKPDINLDNVVIQQFVNADGSSDMGLLIDLAAACDFFQMDDLAHSFMRLYIFQSLMAKPGATVDEIRTHVFAELGEQPMERKDLNATPFKSVLDGLFEEVKSSAGFVAQNVEIRKNNWDEISLDLSWQYVTNLYGLSLVKNKETIMFLDLNNTSLTSILAGAFEGFVQLRELLMSGNPLKTVSAHAFAGLTQLQKLNISENTLSSLPVETFAGLVNLQILAIADNQLAILPEEIFKGLTKLQRLNLGHNQLKQLQPEIFKGLANLQTLYLNHNQLVTLPVGIFKDLTNLQILDIYKNQLGPLQAGVFMGLTNLKELSLWRNNLQLSPGTFSGLTNLQVISLGSNKLNSLPLGIFNNLTNLQRLIIIDGNSLGMTEAQIRALLAPAIMNSTKIE